MYSDYQGRALGRAVRGRGQQRDQEGEEDGKDAPAGRVHSGGFSPTLPGTLEPGL